MDNAGSRHFKGFLWAYISLGVIAVVGGVVSLNFRINDVKRTLFALDSTPGSVQTEATKQLEKIAEMRLLDSDSDGLNDFDEEYTYGTSAYLVDTDSDGISDSAEITAGENPNCAAGTTCATTRTATAVTDVNSITNTNGSTDDTTLSTDDPAALREQLLALGIDKTVLDQVSDEDLVTVYSSVVSDYGSSTTAATNETVDPNANINTAVTNTDPYSDLLPTNNNTNAVGSYTLEDLQNLSVTDIRTLLLQSGIPSSDLDQLDDATLQQLYLDSLAEQQVTQ
ncbi:MAG: hypothetical protein ACD_43C00126G0002 [uncultured bacterium]|nr:MAG: hypothetical protein ACD_43C00126G0002 [uncultured bacterium]